MKALRQYGRQILRALCLLVLSFAAAIPVHATHTSATLLLEEPYGKLGFFTATGHAAVYLSGVCAEMPTVLRPCAPGETGIVLSRYDGVGKYDWVAIPLVPYLYAVEKSDDVPLFADVKMVAFLRDHYRRKYLEDVSPDLPNGKEPGGNWYELIGSSYDRTIYGYEIETSSAQDLALIRKLNAAPNVSHFRTVSRNCADFAKDIINFYHPKALHRSLITDVGITTPKQMAKGLVRYSAHHPDLESSSFIIPQVPGSVARSSNVHGVVESFFKSKKYIVPSAIASPIFAGCVAAVYVGSGTGRFDPARNAQVFNPGTDLDARLGNEDRRAYRLELNHLLADSQSPESSAHLRKVWERLQAHASTEFDEQGRPVLRIQYRERLVNVGISASNVLESDAPPELTQELLAARLSSELRDKAPHGVSESEVTRDWSLLQQVMHQQGEEIAAQSSKPQSLEASATTRNSNTLANASRERLSRNRP